MEVVAVAIVHILICFQQLRTHNFSVGCKMLFDPPKSPLERGTFPIPPLLRGLGGIKPPHPPYESPYPDKKHPQTLPLREFDENLGKKKG